MNDTRGRKNGDGGMHDMLLAFRDVVLNLEAPSERYQASDCGARIALSEALLRTAEGSDEQLHYIIQSGHCCRGPGEEAELVASFS